MQPIGKFLLVVALVAALGSVAYAARDVGDKAATPVAPVVPVVPPVSLVQAASTAERHANGRATRAQYESSTQGAYYFVEVVSGARVFDLKVDADNGGVTSSIEDKPAPDDDDEINGAQATSSGAR